MHVAFFLVPSCIRHPGYHTRKIKKMRTRANLLFRSLSFGNDGDLLGFAALRSRVIALQSLGLTRSTHAFASAVCKPFSLRSEQTREIKLFNKSKQTGKLTQHGWGSFGACTKSNSFATFYRFNGMLRTLKQEKVCIRFGKLSFLS